MEGRPAWDSYQVRTKLKDERQILLRVLGVHVKCNGPGACVGTSLQGALLSKALRRHAFPTDRTRCAKVACLI
jgi:hypothetical protein